MTYSKSNTEKYTLIDDLLDLDIEENYQDNNQANKIKEKYIRNNSTKSNYSELKEKYSDNYTPIQTPIQTQNQTPIQTQNQTPIQNQQIQHENKIEPYQQQNSHNQNFYKPYNNNLQQYNHKPYYNDDDSFYQDDNKLPYYNNYHNIPSNSPYSCLDISSHIENCPICSKFYNTDKTIYVITILILIIFCIILIKKIIDK
jgi:hypothetical protein